MSDLTLDYALPVSALRFSGARTETTDDVLGFSATTITRSGTVALDVVAGRHWQQLVIDGGMLKDTTASFTTTDDGRLTSLSADITGQAGKVVLGVASAAAQLATLVAFAARRSPAADPEQRFAKLHPDVAARRQELREAVADGVGRVAETAKAAFAAPDDVALQRLTTRLDLLERQLVVARAELARLDAQFDAWRATTLHARTVEYERVVTLDTLRGAALSLDEHGEPALDDEGEPVFGGDGASVAKVQELWDALGLLVVVAPALPAQDVWKVQDKNVVMVRTPRPVTITVYERDADGAAVQQRTFQQLVVDAACPIRTIRLDKSWFGRRSTGLTFSALGGLVGLTSTATSSAAALAGVASALPGTVSSGLEGVAKIRTDWSAVQDAGLSEELVRANAEVALKQQQLTQAGLAATTDRYAELARLKQQAEILQQQKALSRRA